MSNQDVALVTGSGSGIGRETALGFAERGTAVVVADIDRAGGEETVSLIEGAGGKALFVETDVTDPDSVAAMVERTVEVFGRLDAAVNNAGIEGRQVPIAEFSEDSWEAIIGVNLTGVWRCLKHELRQMREQDAGGAIVNTGSLLGEVGLDGAAGYTAAKHGVHGLTKAASLEAADYGIRVNAVCPGWVDTPMLQRSRAGSDPEVRRQLREQHPLGRFVHPEEVADAICWLCSEEASFTTGSVLRVDGGFLSK